VEHTNGNKTSLKTSITIFHIYPLNGVTESRHSVDKIVNLLQFVQMTHQVEGAM
jgi:hypothetical protein